MRVLFISNFFPPYDLGGYEQLCQEVTQALRERGHEIVVLTSRYGLAPSSKGEESGGIIRTLYLETNFNYYQPINFFLTRLAQGKANLIELRRVINTCKPDIIVIWGMWTLSYNIPYWAEQWLPGRVAYYIASYWPIDKDPHSVYWQLPTTKPHLEIIKRPFREYALWKLRREGYPPQLKFEHAICCSEYVRSTLVKAGILPASSDVIYNGIDPEPFLSKHTQKNILCHDKSLRLLYFGRLIQDKGVHTALEAISILKQRGQNAGIELTVLGSGHPDYEAKLHQILYQNNIGDQVRFIKQVLRKDVPEWLRKNDIFLFTSIWPEPLARTVMEAMVAGLLVIGTEVGGQVEMLSNGVNSLTFKAGDAVGLAENIVLAAKDPALRLNLATQGRKMVLERFSKKRMVDELEQYLINLTGRNYHLLSA